MPKRRIEVVREYITKATEGKCSLDSKTIENLVSVHIDIKCKCGKIFDVNWREFRYGKYFCDECIKRDKELLENIKEEEKVKDILYMYNSGSCIDIIRKKYKTRNTTISNILKTNGFYIKATYEYKTSKELATGRKYYLDEDTFENIDNHDKAYWLGFLFADGNVSDKKGKNGGTKGIIIELTLKEEDYYHVHNFSTFIKSNYPIKKKIIKLGEKIFIAYRISVGSVKMGKDLIRHGCTPRKSLTLKYPEDLDEQFFGSFLCGYFDGDGCLSYTDYKNTKHCLVSFTGTYDFLNSIKMGLENYNIKTRDISKSYSEAYEMAVSNYDHAKFFNLIYHKSSYMLGRKYDKFIQMLDDRDQEFELSEIANLFRLIY